MAVYIAVGILALIVGLAVFIASRPADFRIERSAQINAPGDIVFALINDLTNGSDGRRMKSSTRT
jgi:hypothetical protein